MESSLGLRFLQGLSKWIDEGQSVGFNSVVNNSVVRVYMSRGVCM